MKSLKTNVIYSILKTGINYAFPLLTYMFAARILGVNQMGRFSFSKNIISFFLIISTFGTDLYGAREGAKIRNNRDEFARFSVEMLIINMIFTSITYISAFFLVKIHYFDAYRDVIACYSIAIVLNCFSMEWFFIALEEYKYIAIRTCIFQLISLIIMFIAVREPGDIILFTLISVFASYGGCIFNFFFVFKTIEIKQFNIHIIKYIKPLSLFCIMNIAVSMYTLLDTTMLGIITNEYEVGLYSAALKSNKIINSFISAIGIALIPRLSFYYGNDMQSKYYSLLNNLVEIISFVSIPLFAITYLFSSDIMILVAGKQYYAASEGARILSMLLIVLPISVMVNKQIFIPTQNEDKVIKSTFVGAVSNIILNSLLIPRYLYKGACLATIVAETMVTLSCIIMCKQKYDVRKLVAAYVSKSVAILPFFITYKICTNLFINRLFLFAITSLIGIIMYLLILFIGNSKIKIVLKELCYEY